jgi:hypothetical protein
MPLLLPGARPVAVLHVLARGAPPDPERCRRRSFSGGGPLDYACGDCGALLCDGMRPGQLVGLVLRCDLCGSTNVVPEARAPGEVPDPPRR